MHVFLSVRLYEEKMKQVETKLKGLSDESAPEYLQGIDSLKEKFERRIQVAGIRKEYKIKLIRVR